MGQICVIMALYTLKGMRIILIWVVSGRYNRYPTLRTKHFFPDVCFSGGNCQADVWILKGSKTPDAEIVWFSLSQIPHIHLPESFFSGELREFLLMPCELISL